MREEKGIIKEYIDDISGIILGEDNIEYFFFKSKYGLGYNR